MRLSIPTALIHNVFKRALEAPVLDLERKSRVKLAACCVFDRDLFGLAKDAFCEPRCLLERAKDLAYSLLLPNWVIENVERKYAEKVLIVVRLRSVVKVARRDCDQLFSMASSVRGVIGDREQAFRWNVLKTSCRLFAPVARALCHNAYPHDRVT